MKTILFTISFIYCLVGTCQTKLKSYKPVKISVIDLSKKTEHEIIRQNELLSKDKLNESEQKELDALLIKYGEVTSSVWDVIDGGCSWYCGGGNYKVKASSNLNSTLNNVYTAKSANDLSYKTAWIEGKPDEGIGEFIEYFFENKSPRITSIIISNGYQKSESTWINNNRVKSLKLYVNNEEYAILRLEDSKTDQEFKIGTLGHNQNGTDLVLKFEILEIYKGAKYNDTAITEIYFDGIDVH